MMHQPAQRRPVLPLVGLARVATDRIIQGSSADFASTQISTERDLGWGARPRGQFGSGIQRPRSSSHGRHGLMARCGPEWPSFATQQDRRSRAGQPKYPPRPRRRTSLRIQRITTAGAAGTLTTIGEAMMGADVGAAVEGSISMIGREVRHVPPTLSPTCHATAGGLMSTAPTVSAWCPCPLLQHTSPL